MQYGTVSRRSGYGRLSVVGGMVWVLVSCDGSGASDPGGAIPIRDGGARDGRISRDARRPDDPARGPEPSISPMLTKLPFTRPARLLGAGISSCSHQEPVPGDRWCAVSQSLESGTEELWVINITAVAAGTPVTCTGTDTNCLRLTDHLWTGDPEVGPQHPYGHQFSGDTLVFYANALSEPTELYEGPIYAWRPGWSVPRQISSDKGILCTPHARGLAAVCLDNIEPDPAKPLEFDLLAGPLPAGPGSQLPRIDRVHPSNANDVTKWRSSFSSDGSSFCYSTGRGPTDAEALWCFKTDELPAQALAAGVRTAPPLVTDAARWAFSRDGQKLYMLKGYNYSETEPKGTLTMVDFPSGANPVSLHEKVGSFLLLSDGTDKDVGLGMFVGVVEGRATLRFLRNRNAPAETLLIATTALSAIVSPDLKYTYLSRDIDADDGLTDAYIARNNEATSVVPAPLCPLQTQRSTDSWGSPFLPGKDLVLWVQDVKATTLTGNGMVANASDCSDKRQYAKNIDFWYTVADEGILFSDDLEVDKVSIRYARFADGKSFTAKNVVKVQGQASRVFSMAMPKRDLLVLEMNHGYPSDGVYLGKLPFGGPLPQPDAGAPDVVPDVALLNAR